MSQRADDKIKHCYRHAKRCRDMALRSDDPSLKAEYQAMEEHWTRLAQNYELTEAISALNCGVGYHPPRR